jgi:hypothetical protein
MAKIGRPGLSREKKAELWERWKGGQCASDITHALERTKGAIHHVLAASGGIAPVARRRGAVALVLDEREEISRGIAAGRSIRRIVSSLEFFNGIGGGFNRSLQHRPKFIDRRFKSQGFSGALIQAQCDLVQVRLGVT